MIQGSTIIIGNGKIYYNEIYTLQEIELKKKIK